MTRKPFVAGNWKMNTTADEAANLTSALAESVGDMANITVGVCPPACYLMKVAEAIGESNIQLGAQNMYYEDKGAFTGEVSPVMLRDCCCTYVILGHSERRHVFHEPDALINRKLLKALSSGLKPILCVGETLDERETGITNDIVERHVAWGLHGVTEAQMADVTIAYEPVWAIGTGKTAQPEEASEVHVFIRGLLAKMFNDDIAQKTIIQYGGSVKPGNVKDLSAQKELDGFLVGGASLKAADFTEIIQVTAKIKSG